LEFEERPGWDRKNREENSFIVYLTGRGSQRNAPEDDPGETPKARTLVELNPGAESKSFSWRGME